MAPVLANHVSGAFLFFGALDFPKQLLIVRWQVCSGTFVLWSLTDDLAIVTLPMNGEPLEPWQQLCELAAIEQDPDHLVELIRVIDRLLKEKEQRSQKARHAKRSLGRKRL